MLICKTNLYKKKLDLYLNYSLRKSRFPLNLGDGHTDGRTDGQTYGQTDGRKDISNYRVASLLKIKELLAKQNLLLAMKM